MYAIFANICFGLMFVYGKCIGTYTHTIGSDAYSAISGHEIFSPLKTWQFSY